MFSTSTARTGAVVVALAAALLVGAPAGAADRAFRDSAGDAPSRVDVRRVTVDHRSRAVRVAVHLDDYRRARGGALDTVVVYVDTVRRRRGPEYFASVEGFHAYFGRMRRWRAVRSRDEDDPFTSGCRGADTHTDLRGDLVLFTLPRTRRCVGLPGRVRVSVLAAHPRNTSGTDYVADHAPARRAFFGWVRVG